MNSRQHFLGLIIFIGIFFQMAAATDCRQVVAPQDQLPEWIKPYLVDEKGTPPFSLFKTENQKDFLLPTGSHQAFLNKAKLNSFGDRLYRGQGLRQPLTESQIKSLFLQPNTILSSKELQQEKLRPTEGIERNFHLVEPWTAKDVSQFRHELPKKFNELVSDKERLADAIIGHSGFSSAVGSEFRSPFISFTDMPDVAGRFDKRPIGIIITVIMPRAGGIDRSYLEKLRIPGLTFTSMYREREFLIYGIVDPESVFEIRYHDHLSGKNIRAWRNPKDLTQVLIERF